MNFAEELKKNPFYILKASPLDTAAQLSNRMNEALLFEENKDAEQAYLTLIHPQHRLEAEMGWFPGETDLAGDLIDYSGTDKLNAVPDIHTESTLGTVNARRTVLEKWPMREPCGAAALAVSLLIALKELSTEKVLEELNCDRAKSKFPEIGQETITHHLVAVQESILKRLTERIGEMSPEDSMSTMKLLAWEYQGEGPLRKYYPLEELVQEHALQMQSEIERLEIELYYLLGSEDTDMMFKAFSAREKEFPKIIDTLNAWDRLTRPLRMIKTAKGIRDQNSLETEKRVCTFMDYCFWRMAGILALINVPEGTKSHQWGDCRELMRTVLMVFFDMDEDKRKKYQERLDTM